MIDSIIALYIDLIQKNKNLSYVSSHSNHITVVMDNIPMGINRMSKGISSNKKCFKKEAEQYEKALRSCIYMNFTK